MGSLGKHKRGGGLAISAQNLLQLPPTLHEAAGVPWSLYRYAVLLQMPRLLRNGRAGPVRPDAGGHAQHITQTPAVTCEAHHPQPSPRFPERLL